MTEAVERYQSIEQHFNFNRSIISDDSERFSNYLSILDEIKRGEIPEDSVDREIARVLSLAMEEDFDPWNIDLVEFSRAYIRKIKSAGDVDFIVAGKIVLLAWSVLKKQSESTLLRAESADEEDYFFEDWSPWDFEPYENIDDISYTNRVLSSEKPPVKKAVRFRASRTVTLTDLIDAFEEARKEMEMKKRKAAIKNRISENIAVPKSSHEEDIEEDIKEVWARILDFKGDNMTVFALSDGTKEDFITVFVAVLFLVKANRIRISQEVPGGDITIENIMPKDENGAILEPPEVTAENYEECDGEEIAVALL